ncbi:hypothetical protein MWU59_08245 [Flavobacteriaceae bacterium F08102]|nr:hypothetical protein [Flavobacteriaceae bacterium F08102]
MKKALFCFWILLPLLAFSQVKRINILHADNVNLDDQKYPDATVLLGNVVVEHEGVTMRSKKAIFYKNKNFIRAFGDVYFNQGDTITQTSTYVEYNGNSKKAKSWGEVVLKDPTMTLTTDTLYLNRVQQLLNYRNGATIRDTTNTLVSKVGNYYLRTSKFEALSSVVLTNPDYVLESDHLVYYTHNGKTILNGPSTITGEETFIYTENGFYDTKKNISHFLKPSKIVYKGREITADSLYYDRNLGFASAVMNIKLTDTANNSLIRGNYAEVYQKLDSAFVVDRAVAISEIEKDSLYIHGDTLLITGKPEKRVIRAFHHVKFFKSDLSGKCDSIYSDQKTGLTKMFNKPILWSNENQVYGDTIHLVSNIETEKLDSIKVLNNAFIMQKDSVGNLNQIKGRNILGRFIDNDLDNVLVVGNAEVIFFIRDEAKDELIGINKRSSSSIRFFFEEGKIKKAAFYVSPEGTTYPPSELPEEERLFQGAVWRIDEKPLKMEDIFNWNTTSESTQSSDQKDTANNTFQKDNEL